jgi:ABC-type bacteriocin/lantibiotic exporter with double-glycine peptidase domain
MIPYERQANRSSCGAAALSMVYRSYGIEVYQDDIWKAVAGRSARGRACAHAQSLAADALRRGLHASAIQVRDPWLVLKRCLEQSVRIIINHVPELNSGSGHFSVLTGMDDHYVIMHDPNDEPDRSMSRDDFLRLWNPRSPQTEIISQVMVAIADIASTMEQCALCKATSGDVAICKVCEREVSLQPLAILGCLTDWCPMRAWEMVFCPWCSNCWKSGLGK